MTLRSNLAAGLGVLLLSMPALALVGKDTRVADFALEDPEGKVLRFSSLSRRAVLMIYEDRSAVEWNAGLKKRLSRDKSLPRSLMVLPIADMRRYGYWPARSIAQKEMKRRSKEMGRTLYGDWNGEAAKALRVVDKTSSVVLVGEDGRVLFCAAGRLSPERVDELVAQIRRESKGGSDDARDSARTPETDAAKVTPPASSVEGTAPAAESPRPAPPSPDASSNGDSAPVSHGAGPAR